MIVTLLDLLEGIAVTLDGLIQGVDEILLVLNILLGLVGLHQHLVVVFSVLFRLQGDFEGF